MPPFLIFSYSINNNWGFGSYAVKRVLISLKAFQHPLMGKTLICGFNLYSVTSPTVTVTAGAPTAETFASLCGVTGLDSVDVEPSNPP